MKPYQRYLTISATIVYLGGLGLAVDHGDYKNFREEQAIIREEIPSRLNVMKDYIVQHSEPDSIEQKLNDDLYYFARRENLSAPLNDIGGYWENVRPIVAPLKRIAWETGTQYIANDDGWGGTYTTAKWNRTQAREWFKNYYKKDRHRLLDAIDKVNRNVDEYNKKERRFIPFMTPITTLIGSIFLYFLLRREQ